MASMLTRSATQRLLPAASLSALLALTGCGGGSPSATPPSISAEPIATIAATGSSATTDDTTPSTDDSGASGAPAASAGTAAPAPGPPRTLRELAQTFVADEANWSGDATDRLHLVDLTRALEAAQPGASTTLSAPERRGLLEVGSDVMSCVPSLMASAEAFGWESYDVEAVTATQCRGNSIIANVQLSTPLASQPLTGDFVDVGDGLLSSLAGDDGQPQGYHADAPRLSSINVPVRIAAEPDALFLSLSTQDARAWAAADPAATLAGDEHLMRVLDTFDSFDAFSASIAPAVDPMADLERSRDPNREALILSREATILIRQQCTYLGVGQAVVGTELRTIVAYGFADDATASAALPSVQATWSDTSDLVDLSTWPYALSVDAITQHGPTIAVVVDVGPNADRVAATMGTTAPVACMGDA